MTFQELQRRLTQAQHRKAILLHLIEHVDSNFRPLAGQDSKHKLLTETKSPVPPEAFESVVEELLQEVATADTEIQNIMSSSLSPESPSQKSKKN